MTFIDIAQPPDALLRDLGKDSRLVSYGGANFGMALDLIEPATTRLVPNDCFFVRSNGPLPVIDPVTWRLTIDGAVSRPLSLTLDDLTALPPVRLESFLECAGNGRTRFDPLPPGTPWVNDAIGNAVWEGVSLATVLDLAGVAPGTVDIVSQGGDFPEMRRGLPLANARDPDVLLAWRMNDAPLPVAHGGPVRLLVPGWAGIASTKWIVGLTALDRPFDGFWNTDNYVVWDEHGDALRPVAEMPPKSLIASLRDGQTVTAGEVTIQLCAGAYTENLIISKDLSIARAVAGVTQLDLTLADRLEAFRKNVPFVVDNLTASLLMFNYRGHASFFDGAPEGFPALDFFSGALFALGLGLVVWRIIRRRDPVDWLLPVALIILVLPGALAIAYTVEVPSFTRSSGTLPIVYLITALPLALLLREVYKRITWNRLRYAIVAGVVVLLILGAVSNADVYFVRAMDEYRDSTLPHRQAGRIMQGFINSTGAPGNAFVDDFDYWWDYRALGIEAGDPHWANIIWRNPSYKESLILLIQRNMRTPYEFRPDREVLIFVEPNHTVMLDLLREVFPKGSAIKVPSFKPSRDFLIYTVPPVGCDWMQTNIGQVPASCEQDASRDTDTTTPAPQDITITPVP